MEVHNNLGAGFSEIVYKDALELEFKNAKIEYSREKEDARAFLPSNVQCKRLYMTFTINSLNKFLELRTDPHAQTEIRSYALDIKYLLDK
jgi:thymidylate synthase ThyX